MVFIAMQVLLGIVWTLTGIVFHETAPMVGGCAIMAAGVCSLGVVTEIRKPRR